MSRSRLAAACAVWIIAVIAGTAAPEPADPGQDAVLQAIHEELGRAMKRLQLGALGTPYYLDVLVSDQATVELGASFGAVVSLRRDRSRPLRVSARVGSYEQDNSEFVSASRSFSRQGATDNGLPIEDEELALRRELWLAFDAAYKQALEQLAAKRATLENRIVKEHIPDFAPQQAVTSLAPRQRLTIDIGEWEGVLRRLSAVLREFPAVQQSRVVLRVQAANRYFVSSEGTQVREPAHRAMLLVQASTQAPDGMALRNFLPVFAGTLAELPAEAELAERVRAVARELTALVAAPVLGEYVGPVLFTEQAAAELFAQLLAPELSGHRPPLFEDDGMATMAPRSELAQRLNRLVLPPFLSVVDDAATRTFAGQTLIGAYAFDDQGVPATRVTLVEHGRLKTLLMSRRPRVQIPSSNGHGRAEPFGGLAAHVGNLVVTSRTGLTLADLKQQLLGLARDAGLTHGLLIRRMEDGGPLAGGDGALRSFRLGRRGLGMGLADPVLAYRVSVTDASEELVRGVSLSGLTVRTLREAAAAGVEPFVDNRFATHSGNLFAYFGGAPTDLGVPCAVVAPALLLPDVEASPREGEQQRPALLSHPFFDR